MRAVAFLLGTWPRRRRLALAGIAVLAAFACGFVLLAGLGARRAGSAWENLRQQTRAEDLMLDAASPDAALDLAERASRVPGVDRAAAAAYAVIVPEGRLEDFYGGVILPLTPGALEKFFTPVLTSGRHADPSRADEVVVNALYLDAAGVAIGDRVTLVDALGFIHQPVTVVGVGVFTVDFTYGAGAPLAYVTDGFAQRWAGGLQSLFDGAGVNAVVPLLLVAEEKGTDNRAVRERLDEALPADLVVGRNDATTGSALVVDTLDLLRNAYVAVALVGGLAALSILGLVLSRLSRLLPAERVALTALGFAPRQLRWAVLLPGAVVAGVGAVAATLVARLGQGLVPTGVAGFVDAGRAAGADTGFLMVGGLVVLGALLAAVVLAARPPRPRRTPRARPTGAGPVPWRWPSVGAGLRAATGGLAAAGRRQAVAAFAAVAIATVGIAAVAVVVRSRDGLSQNPDRVGKFFDVALDSYSDPAAAASDREALLASPKVSGVATIETFTIRADGIGIPAIAVVSHKGGMGLTILTGRAPVGPDEAVAATPLLRRLELAVGDSVEVAGPAGSRDVRIVGTAVMPFATSTSIAEELALTTEGRQALDIEPNGLVLGIDVFDRAPLRAIDAGFDSLNACDTTQLESILGAGPLAGPASGTVLLCVTRIDQRATNIEELGSLPAALTGLLTALGIAGLAYLLGASFRRARRDLALLRVLGFTRAQSVATSIVHAGSVGLVGSLVALPLGVALGRAAWRNIATGIGFAPTAEVSLIGTVGVVGGAVLVGVVLALPFAARMLSRPPAAWLRAE